MLSTLSGARRAYLEMAPNAPPEQYTRTIEALHKQKLLTLPGEYDGKPALEIRDFKNDKDLLNQLSLRQVTQGPALASQMKEDKHSAKATIAARSLNWAGYNYVIGDAAIVGYAIREKSWREMVAASGYLLGTQSLLWYGKDQTPTHLRDMAKDMLAHMHTKGIDVPAESAAFAVAKDDDKSVGHKIDTFMRRYPSEVMGASFALAGIGMFISAAVYKGAKAKLSLQDKVLGSITLASGLTSAFVSEKPHDPNQPPAEGLKKVWEWVQEKPLRIAGYGLMASTVIHGWSTARGLIDFNKIWKETGDLHAKKQFNDTLFRGTFVVTNLIAEFLISMSSKGHGNGAKKADTGAETSAYELAADILSRQDKEHYALAEESLANFLCHRNVLALPKEEVLQGIRHQASMMKENPWALHAPANLVPKNAYLTEDGKLDYNKRSLRHQLIHTFPQGRDLLAQQKAMEAAANAGTPAQSPLGETARDLARQTVHNAETLDAAASGADMANAARMSADTVMPMADTAKWTDRPDIAAHADKKPETRAASHAEAALKTQADSTTVQL